MKRKGTIRIVRTEQWEWTAVYGKGKNEIRATGSSESQAELHLLRKMVFGTDTKEPKEEWCL